MSSNTLDDDVFQYTGRETVPKDATIVHFHCSITDVENQTFRECTHMKVKEIVLNNGLQTIGQSAFAYCTSLERITIPSTVTDIGNCAFGECKSLREVVLNDGLEKIGNSAFRLCTSLESITIPSSVNNVNQGAFLECHKLKEVVLNNGLERIGLKVFASCKSLQSITIPSSVVEIGNSAFKDCIKLKDLVLNEGLVKIGHGVYRGCCSLESINLPTSVVKIGNYVFNSCLNLREVICSGGLPEIDYYTFNGCQALKRITFPNLSSCLEDIIRAGQVDIENKIQQYTNRGEIEWERGGTIYIPVEVTRSRDEWGLLKQCIDQIINWIRYYEMKEATTIFELALWKAKIDQVEDDICASDRDTCRVEVPGPVKDTILQYIDL